MDRQLRTTLHQQKRLLEAQINECHFSLGILEDNRLLIRTSLSIECVPPFWNSSREVLNGQIRTHVAMIAEYHWLAKKLARLDEIHSTNSDIAPDSPEIS